MMSIMKIIVITVASIIRNTHEEEYEEEDEYEKEDGFIDIEKGKYK